MIYGKTNAAFRKSGTRFFFTVGETVYEYNGTDLDNSNIKTLTNVTNKTVKCWIKTSGTLMFKSLPKSKKARVFACGAGNNGGNGYHLYDSDYCGAGGRGGGTASNNSYDLVTKTELPIVVGSGDTTGMSLTATKGTGSNGGDGAHLWYDTTWQTGTHYYIGSNGSDGVYAFGEESFDGIKYGAGGGGGEVSGEIGYAGGESGGAGGALSRYTTPNPAQANMGGGGGGGGIYNGQGGLGGTGIFIFETLEAE